MSRIPRNARKPHPKKTSTAATTSTNQNTTTNKTTIAGSSSNGERYNTVDEMWDRRLTGDLYDAQSGWYGKAQSYWKAIPPTIDGVLGGMGHVHAADIKESKAFIEGLQGRGTTRALDCGAGIGRITRNLLVQLYTTVDLLEPVETMLNQAKEELKEVEGQIGHYYLNSMERHVPEEKYDLVVIQWAAIYLTDEDFVKVFHRYKDSLTENGYIFFKENCSSRDDFLVDEDDSSLTRSDKHYKMLFEKADVKVVKEKFQKEWPSNLMKVKMYALK